MLRRRPQFESVGTSFSLCLCEDSRCLGGETGSRHLHPRDTKIAPRHKDQFLRRTRLTLPHRLQRISPWKVRFRFYYRQLFPRLKMIGTSDGFLCCATICLPSPTTKAGEFSRSPPATAKATATATT